MSNDYKPKPEYRGTTLIKLRQEVQDKLGIGITDAQKHCASLVYTSLRAYQHWERNERKIHPGFMELLVSKLNPDLEKSELARLIHEVLKPTQGQ